MGSIYDVCKPDTGNDEIRVVILKSGQPDDPITCQFAITKLEDPSDYIALSYTWLITGDLEDEPPLRDIQVSADVLTETVPIRHNLHTFLTTIRQPHEEFTFWIDALCINQDPTSTEKQMFVPIMDRIYRSAKETFIWLGPASEDSGLAMQTINTFPPAGLAKTEDINPRAPHWVALRKLVRRPYWSRLWVLQEALLSRSPMVICGAAVTPLEKFVALRCAEEEYGVAHIQAFGGLHLFFGCALAGTFLYWTFDRQRLLGPAKGKGINLHDWFSWTTRLGCAEPLDRVYALLGLIDPEERKTIDVSYDADPALIYAQAVKHFFEVKGIEALHNGYIHERDAGLKIPSWVPDWSRDEEHVPLFNWPRIDNDPHRRLQSPLETHTFWLQVSGWPGNGPGRDCCVDLSTQHLGVQALIVDKITYHDSTPVVPHYSGLDLDHYEVLRWKREDLTVESCHRWEQHVDSLPITAYDREDGGRYEAFWRTLICDRIFDWQSRAGPSEDYAEMYEIFMRRRLVDLSRPERKKEMFGFYAPAVSRCATRAFASTKGGRFGLVPGRATVGDAICLLKGGTTSFVLRQAGDEWSFVGEAYIHGLMDAKILDAAIVEDVKEVWLV